LREALKVLAVDGLVYLEPNCGACVSKFTLEEFEEVLDLSQFNSGYLSHLRSQPFECERTLSGKNS